MKLRILLVTVIILFNICTRLKAQDLSNKGKDFWLAYAGHIDALNSRMALYISSDQSTTGTVQLDGKTISFTVTANQATVVQIYPNSYNVYNAQSDGINAGKGIHITAGKPIVVYAHILNAARSGSSLILPTPTLGREYTCIAYKQTNSQTTAKSQFTIVGVEDATTVEITPTAASINNTKPAGTPFTIVLNKGDVYQYQSNTDVTGSKVKSLASGSTGCKPLAVFSGSTWNTFDCTNASGGDNLYQQLFPSASWGKNYVTSPFATRPYDIFRILVGDPTTVVKLNGTALNPSTLVNNSYYEFKSSTGNVISSDKPVLVIQYMVSQTCDTRNPNNCGGTGQPACPYPADPEMVILNAVEQTLNNVTVLSARRDLTPPNTNITSHYLNIITKASAVSSVKIDGSAPLSAPQAIPGSGYVYFQENVTSSTQSNPTHTITGDSGFIAIAYGLGQVESYGYNAGTNVKDLYQFVSIKNQFANVNEPSTCKNTPFVFSITLPYKPTSLNWDFNSDPNLSPNTAIVNSSPVEDSTYTKDGKTLYVYSLKGKYTFGAIGTYPVKVTANNPTPDGCSGIQEINYTINVFDPPVADFSLSQTGCVSDTSFFKDSTNGSNRQLTKWFWDFGDGTTDSVKNPIKNYTTPNTYNVKLVSITDLGCFNEVTKSVIITTKPIAKFGFSKNLCVGNVITFTDSSTIASGSIINWTWNFGEGSAVVKTDNSAVRHIYNNTGKYTVTLEVETTTGCKSLVYKEDVNIYAFPVADFTFSEACLPYGSLQFVNKSTSSDPSQPSLTYNWTFGDGATSVATDTSHRYASVGPFDVKLTVTSFYGCTVNTVKSVNTIYPQPKVNFTVSAEVCLGDSTIFTDESTGATIAKWRWDFGDGETDSIKNPKHVYASAGTDSVKLFVISDKGCNSDTVVKTTVVNPLPVADFSIASPICETKAVAITDKSSVTSGTLTKWNWNFGDGTNAVYNNPNSFNKIFDTASTYLVKLQVETGKGCVKDTTKAVKVNNQPVPDFILPEVCLSDAFAEFKDSSSIKDKTESGFAYAWNFGDANATPFNQNTSTIKDARHKYSAVGVYNVSLRVTSKDGCVATVLKPFTVNGAIPIADFTVINSNALCSNTKVEIQNKSTVDFGTVTKLEIFWDFAGNPTTIVTDNNPTPDKLYSHIYPNSQTTKTYQVKVRVFSGGSCVNERTKSITVNAAPKVSFTTIPGICLDGASRQITQAVEAGSVPGSGSFSGTGVSGVGLFNPATAGVGVFPIQYLYVSNAGCRDSATKSITVWKSPDANFGYTNPTCEANGIAFSDSSIANFSKINQWNWTFGDGTTNNRTSAATFNKTFASAGTFSVSLRVVTDSGCQSALISKTIIVHALPVVDFTLPSVCLPGGNAQFNDLSTIADGTANQFDYLWSFGDPVDTTPSALKNPTHKYSNTGPFSVKLQVTSSNGCVASATKSLSTVYDPPTANFTVTPADACLGSTFTFTDASTGVSGNITSWAWNLGDGTTTSTQNTFRKYTTVNTFDAALTVTNDRGCVSAPTIKKVVVHPYPAVNAGPDLVVLEGGSITINPTVSGSGLSYKWTPSTYLNNDAILKPTTSPTADVTYRLTVTGTGGCATSDDVFVKLLLAPTVPNAFSPNGDGINDTWNIEYLNSYPGATIEIFNRYGQMVYKTKGYNQAWDGKLNGNILPVGIYYYIIDPKNGRKQISGSVTILR